MPFFLRPSVLSRSLKKSTRQIAVLRATLRLRRITQSPPPGTISLLGELKCLTHPMDHGDVTRCMLGEEPSAASTLLAPVPMLSPIAHHLMFSRFYGIVACHFATYFAVLARSFVEH